MLASEQHVTDRIPMSEDANLSLENALAKWELASRFPTSQRPLLSVLVDWTWALEEGFVGASLSGQGEALITVWSAGVRGTLSKSCSGS